MKQTFAVAAALFLAACGRSVLGEPAPAVGFVNPLATSTADASVVDAGFDGGNLDAGYDEADAGPLFVQLSASFVGGAFFLSALSFPLAARSRTLAKEGAGKRQPLLTDHATEAVCGRYRCLLRHSFMFFSRRPALC